MNLIQGAPRPDPVEYMTQVAASGQGHQLRDHVLAALDLRPGQAALDVGCGPGVNLVDLAAGVTGTGTVIGIDRDPVMVAVARRRAAGLASVHVLPGDAHALPVAAMSVDRARVPSAAAVTVTAAAIAAAIAGFPGPWPMDTRFDSAPAIPDRVSIGIRNEASASLRGPAMLKVVEIRT